MTLCPSPHPHHLYVAQDFRGHQSWATYPHPTRRHGARRTRTQRLVGRAVTRFARRAAYIVALLALLVGHLNQLIDQTPPVILPPPPLGYPINSTIPHKFFKKIFL